MSITVSQLIGAVEITGVEQGERKLIRMGMASDSLSDKLKVLAIGGAVVAGAAIVTLGEHVTRMAADFETQTNMFVTSAGELPRNLDMVRQGVLKMAVDTATSTSQLNAGMYMVESAGYHGAAGLKVLQAAAMGARAENADLATVTNAVTSALNAYHLGAGSAIPVTNDLVAAVGAGKMHMQDLAGALKNVLPAAAAAHISLSDVTAAIATMTMQGDPAVSAATHLRQVILALEAPAEAGAKALKEIGLTTQQVTDEMRKSLPDTLAMIEEHLKKKFPEGSAAYNAALKSIAGGNKQLLGMLELIGPHMQTYEQNVRQVTSAVQKGGQAIYGWDVVQSSFNFKLDKAKEVAETLGITVGTALLPVFGKVLDNLTPMITQFGDWITSGGRLNTISQDLGNTLSFMGEKIGTAVQRITWLVQQFTDTGAKGQILRGVLWTIAGAVAGIKIAELGTSFVTAMTQAGASTIAFGAKLLGLEAQASATAVSVKAVGTSAVTAGAASAGAGAAGMAGLGAAMAPIIGIVAAVRFALGTLPTTAKGVFSDMGDQIDHFTMGPGGMWWMAHNAQATTQHVNQSFSNMAKQVYSDTSALTSEAIAAFQRLNGDLTNQMQSIDANVIGYWNDVANYISSHQITGQVSWVSAGGPISPGGPVGGTMQHFAEGTSYAPGGWSWFGERGPELAYIPRGSQVVPHNQSMSMASSSGAPVQININIAGHRVESVLLPRLVQAIRSATGVKF